VATRAVRTRTMSVDERLVLVAVAIGVLLRTWQFVGDTSLYWGELALARNIEARSLIRLLTERTAFGQGSAFGYLAMQKAIVSVFGSNELTHRLFPFLASVLSLWLFRKLANLYLTGSARVFAVVSFALGFPFILITSPFKPLCTVDTAATLVLFLVAHDLLSHPATIKRSVRAGVLGFAMMWFAEAAAILSVALVAVLCLSAIRQRNWTQCATWLPAFAFWLVGAAAAPWLAYGMTDAATRAVLHDLYAGGTLPALPHLWTQAIWLWNRMYDALGPDLFHYRMRTAYIVIIVLGLWPLWQQRSMRALLLLAPIVAAVVASGFGWYIFQSFYLAFLFPYFFVLSAMGLDFVRQQLSKLAAPAGLAWMAGWTLLPVAAIAQYPPPYRVEEMKPVLQYVRAHWQPGDALYGFFATSHALAFYGPKLGFQTSDMLVGTCHHGEAHKYFEEVDTFRGRPRVWAVFTHDLARYQARAEVLNYLNRIGTLRDSVINGPPALPTFVVGAWAYLYDLSDSTKLASVTAQTMPLLRPTKASRGFMCGGGMLAADQP